jgi:hypothetical protein
LQEIRPQGGFTFGLPASRRELLGWLSLPHVARPLLLLLCLTTVDGGPRASPRHPHCTVKSEVRGLVSHGWPVMLIDSVFFHDDRQVDFQLNLKRTNIASSGTIVVPIRRPGRSALIGRESATGHRNSINRQAARQEGMGLGIATVVLNLSSSLHARREAIVSCRLLSVKHFFGLPQTGLHGSLQGFPREVQGVG